MKRRTSTLVVLACAALAAWGASVPKERRLCSGFLPENDMKIPVGFSDKGISEQSFNRVLDRVEAVYRPLVAAKGGKLLVDRKWEDATVNAYASQSGDTWKISMFGGLARHPVITEDAFAMVACHEIGHHIGGHPKMGWATNEGGADYFATLKCLRRVLPATAPSDVDAFAAAACDRSFRDRASRNECKAAAMAGFSGASLFQALRNSPALSFSTPDPAVVAETDDSHPAAQCRLDTYFQGALCTASLSQDVSNSDANAGACTRKSGYSAGLRPRCWYKPPADEPAALEVASKIRTSDVEAIKERLSTLSAALGGK